MTKERRIPSIIGIIFLLISIIAGVYFTQFRTTFKSKASGDCSPINSQITNITNNSVDISFTTTGLCQSTVVVQEKTYLDVKAQSGASPETTIHYFQIKNLQPKTKYVFSIISGGAKIELPTLSFTTSATPSTPLPTSNIAWGKVLSADGVSPANGIVYLNIPGAAPLSSFITSNGNWSISLASSYNDSKTNWFSPPESGIDEEIIVISDDGQTTQVTSNTLSNNPVPDIIVGTNSFNAPTKTPITDQSYGIGQVGNVSASPLQKTLDIQNPKNNESITTSIPDFFGTSPASVMVEIFLDSGSTPAGRATSDATGVWHWSPPAKMDIGAHIITAKVTDPTSKLVTQVSRNFTILSSDASRPQYEASSSAKPTITQTPVPTQTPTTIPSPSPTIRTAHPSTTIKPPVTGNTIPTVIVIVCSLLFFVISVNLIK